MLLPNRRSFLAKSSALGAGICLANNSSAWAQPPATQATATNSTVTNSTATNVSVEYPKLRIPVSFIIDDSTCLVNMGKFCMPQFKTAWPDRSEYDQPWKQWPDEIPDEFVRKFGTWCAEHGVRGKYSVVPFPACVGWLDRELPGWSRKDLESSLKLMRELMVPHWDIHPEMITHTRVIDLKSGRPIEEINSGTMENSFPQQDKSVDELAAYLAYALRILKNCDLPCEGITTPGGFGNRVKDKLPLAVFEAVRDVFGTELPHYFKYISSRDEPTEPRMEGVREIDSDSPRVTVNVPAGTGDWFGGWDGARPPEGDKYATIDATSGRMIELLEQKKPAIMFCHWAGLYGNGTEEGFRQMQRVITAIEGRFRDQIHWWKISEIGRYWAAKQFTSLRLENTSLHLKAPYSASNFTLRIRTPMKVSGARLEQAGEAKPLSEATGLKQLSAGQWLRDSDSLIVCFDLPKGDSTLQFVAIPAP